LTYAREPLVFELAAPHFGALDGLTFQTRLLGYSDGWSAPSPTPRVSFTNLEGGPFTLEVRALDVTGRLSEPAHLTFTVAPPWPRSTPAKVAYATMGGLVLLTLFRWRLYRVERERAHLETIVATRTAELATARNDAEAASRAKSDFLASMSHELRTPLNGVIGYAQLLQRDPRLAPVQRERVGIVHRCGEHLLHMINDVLDLAKIEAGKLDLRLEPFAVADLLRDLVAAHAAVAATKGLQLTLTIAPDLALWSTGDVGKIRQVADNLIGNAIKFTTEGGVEVFAAPLAAGFGIMLRVTDTGPGIAAEDQSRIFLPFEQGRRQRTSVPGTGLGLAISRSIVTRMGGSLTLQPETGGGSCFEVSLPLEAVAVASIAGPKPGITGYFGPRRHVLIVDDHAVNRALLVDLLEPLGFRCAAFESGVAALQALADSDQPPPDLAIIDVRMTGMDGLEVTRVLRARPASKPLRIVLTSASVLSFDPAVGRAAGCDDFLPKPFRVEVLLELAGRLLGLTWDHRGAAMLDRGSDHPRGLDPTLRRELRETLAAGDIEVLQRQIESNFATYPDSGDALDELAEAAARFDLARLRRRLDEPASAPTP
jgi:signal transduction histidine kinase/CheY-like chemotaxis protein